MCFPNISTSPQHPTNANISANCIDQWSTRTVASSLAQKKSRCPHPGGDFLKEFSDELWQIIMRRLVVAGGEPGYMFCKRRRSNEYVCREAGISKHIKKMRTEISQGHIRKVARNPFSKHVNSQIKSKTFVPKMRLRNVAHALHR